MKLIPLTRGKFAQVDDGDYDFLMQWKWRAINRFDGNGFYALNDKVGRMHRLILSLNSLEICDHIDGNGLNNERYNLRKCTHGQNMRNRIKHKSTISKFKGIYFDKKRNRWRSAIRLDGIVIRLGRFRCEVEAAKAYDEAAKKHFGEFANLNFK